jgi:hypothetical protein
MGRWLIVAGGVLILVGLLVHFGLLNWFGRLPGDIRIESGRTRVFIPLTSMLIVSVVLSLVVQLFIYLFRR